MRKKNRFRRHSMNQLAAVYARVSTLQQEQEATIDSQVAEVERYAREKGYRLSKEYYFLDQAISGAQLARPALDRLRDLAGEGLFEAVLCLSPDRLSRQYAHQWIILEELKRAGIKVAFINQPSMEDNPQGQLLLGIQGLFSEYERAVITDRLRRGKLHRVRQDGLVNPVPPYGYRYIPISEPNGGRWEAHPIEQEAVRQIYTAYTETNLKIGQIVDRLNENTVKMPPRGRRWGYSTVQAILKQPAYTGKTHYNRTRVCHEAIGRAKKHGRGLKRTAVHQPRPKEEWIPMKVPALISEEMWQKAQERLAMNLKFSSRNNTTRFYLLHSLLVCDVCGRTLAGRSVAGTTVYYCGNYGKNRSPDVPIHTRAISSSVIEPLIWQAVRQLLQNPTLLADAWESESQTDSHAPEERDRLQSRLKALERQWQRLLDLFQDEKMEKAELSKRKEQLDQERQSIQTRLQQFNRLAQQERMRQTMLEDFATFCQQVMTNLDNPTPQLKQEVIRLLIDHVIVGKDEIVIKHIVPTDDDCRLLPGRRFTLKTQIFFLVNQRNQRFSASKKHCVR
ncbi:MAG: recombinase family protein [Anaerolineales bacterium]|nr:recombinase family protein [Anaerolineales bacterium]